MMHPEVQAPRGRGLGKEGSQGQKCGGKKEKKAGCEYEWEGAGAGQRAGRGSTLGRPQMRVQDQPPVPDPSAN